MGKYGIGARVRDEDGDEGVIVDKRKGERRVRFEWDDSPSVVTMWMPKSELTPVEAANDNAAEGPWVPKVGDRVLAEGRGWGDTKNIGFVTKVVGEDAIVEFGDGWSDGHAGGEVDGASNRWFFSKNKIEPARLTIEAGRYYKTRDGRKVGPMEVSDWEGYAGEGFAFTGVVTGEPGWAYYLSDGEARYLERGYEIIAEWADEPVVAVEATELKAGDRVRRIKSTVAHVCPVGFETVITKVGDGVIWYLDVDGDETSSTAGHGVWEILEPAAPTETPAAKFKVGDRVRCLETYGRQFTAGNTYEVVGTYMEGDKQRLLVALDDGGSTTNGWLSEKFELVTDEPKSDTITVTLKVDSEPLGDAFRTIAAALNRAADDISAA